MLTRIKHLSIYLKNMILKKKEYLLIHTKNEVKYTIPKWFK